uniref:Cytochrome P450 716B1 n=1 Tax=Aegilops tauschii subsp. strangulata TaxID=200361 RepID=A0A453IW13_AEGTS
MAYSILLGAVLALLVAAVVQLLYKNFYRLYYSAYKLPPGNLGVPAIGSTFSLLRACRSNTDDQWFRDRIKKYGPVSTMSLFGSPTVLLAGPAANHFIFGNDRLILTQTRALRALVGRSVLALTGSELKLVRSALQGYLKPEMVRRYVCKIDHEVRSHIELNWVGRDSVTVLPTVRRLSLAIICSVVLGQESATIKKGLCTDFVTLGKAILSFPVNIPFTRFNKGMAASAKIRKAITNIAHKREESLLQEANATSDNDFISYMLILRSQGAHSLTLEDIVDNAMGLIVGAHETTSALITFMIRYLSKQDEIAQNKNPEDALTWDHVAKMKYMWKVAMETLRTIPPVFGSFRTTTKDIEYQGYHIPKGWKVFTAQSVTHMDSQFFHEPNKFNPSRFEKSAPPYCYMPFGGGPRMCPGNVFARVETMVAMHYLVRQFRWKITCEKETYKRDPKPTPVLGLPIKLKLRPLA